MINTSRKMAAEISVITAVSILALGSPSLLAKGLSDGVDAARGGALWSENCARCHNMRSPSDLNSEQWITSVYHMRLRAGLTGQETRDILAFLQNATQTATQAAVKTESQPSPISVRSAKDIYTTSCSACHGDKGQGNLPGVPDLTSNKGRLMKPDNVLLANIVSGMQTPGNVMAMPPKGGNADLTDKELGAVITYLRSLTGVTPDE